MSRRRKPGGKSLDVVQRLQQRVSEGEFYEALQLYKTSYSRLKAQGKLDSAEELLVAGAVAMSRENEVGGAKRRTVGLPVYFWVVLCAKPTCTISSLR